MFILNASYFKKIKFTKKNSIHICKRYYPGNHNKNPGHARRILDAISKVPPSSHNPLGFLKAQTHQNATHPTPHAPIKSLSDSSFKEIILKLIPSTRPNQISSNFSDKNLFHIQQKEALVHFLQYFENLPKEHVKNYDFFIAYFKYLTETHPEIFVRSLQLCLEIYFNKAQFKEDNIQTAFENKFEILDLINRNKSNVDMSTLFSALQTNHLFTQQGFSENITACLLISTCLDSKALGQLPPALQTRLQNIKIATGNTLNDIDLNGHHYDFKITNEPSFGRNHIMFISVNTTNNSFKTITTKMFFYMKQELDIFDKKKRGNGLTNEEKFIIKMFGELHQRIQNLNAEQSLKDSQKFYLLNEFIFSKLHIRPSAMRIPLFIPLSEHPYKPHPQLKDTIDKINLPDHKNLIPSDIHRAISGAVIKSCWNKETFSKAFDHTQGRLHIEEVD